MVLESTMVCVDNSEFMRNGDFVPTRLQAQQDAVNIVCHSKTRSNPENNVGLITMANTEVLVTLTTDVGKILAKLHQVAPNGESNFLSAIRVAHLTLKHRQGRNHRMRIVAFVGSPVLYDDKEITRLAKRLKKEKVQVDVISFGEEAKNTTTLTTFINTLNGKDGSGSHLVTVPPGPHLSDALISSPVVQGEDGAGAPTSGFEFGVDPNEDPELALALRVSMEEQRQRQEEESRRVQQESATETGKATPATQPESTTEEALLEQALAMSMGGGGGTTTTAGATATATAEKPSKETKSSSAPMPDFAQMSEEEQIAYAMQMSMQESQDQAAKSQGKDSDKKDEAMEVDEPKKEGDEDYSIVMGDAEFLQSVLETLPGVDPKSALGSFQEGQQKEKKDKDSDKKDGD